MGKVDLNIGIDPELLAQAERLGIDVGGMDERPQMFTVILAAFADGDLAGIGALTPEPEPAAQPAFRMRRLYVRRALRRRGVARALASALLQEALGGARLVTVHAGNPDAARFWEAQGFGTVEGAPWSHVYSAA